MADTHTAMFDWGDGTAPAPATLAEPGTGHNGTVTGSHTYAAAGTYTVSLTVYDNDGGKQTLASKSFVVVFNLFPGFVTGGGWIDSPVGAWAQNKAVVGKGRFGFVSKNKQGTSTPTGQTQFTLNAGNLNFHSTAYDWMSGRGPVPSTAAPARSTAWATTTSSSPRSTAASRAASTASASASGTARACSSTTTAWGRPTTPSPAPPSAAGAS